MSDSKKGTIAEQIIEAFGGIRPMASKLGVPVTTVQGWKKRQAIPETRFDQVLSAAKECQVLLSREMYAYLGQADLDDGEIEAAMDEIRRAVADEVDLDGDASEDNAGENVRIIHSTDSVDTTPDTTPRAADSAADGLADSGVSKDRSANVSAEKGDVSWRPPRHNESRQEEIEALIQAERKRVVKAWGFSVLALILAVCAMGLVLVGPASVQDKVEQARSTAEDIQRLKDLRRDIHGLKSQNSELARRLEMLESVNSDAELMVRLQRLIENNPAVISGDKEIVSRLSKLEQKYAELRMLENKIDPFIDHMGLLSQSTEGQGVLGNSMTDISEIVMQLQGRVEELDQALEKARQDDEELAGVLESVSKDDLTAAAMLLALNQLRANMDQQQNFEQDLAIIKELAGDDPELQAAIDRLAPYAESGILSKQGLSREFKSIASEVVMAKLAGEDVSVKDKVMSRLGEIVSVRKQNPEGEDTEAIVARAEALLDRGDVKGAIAELEKLEGAPAEAAKPWMDRARGSVAADDVSTMMISKIASRLAHGKISGIENLKRKIESKLYGKYPDPNGRGFNIKKRPPMPLLNDPKKGLH